MHILKKLKFILAKVIQILGKAYNFSKEHWKTLIIVILSIIFIFANKQNRLVLGGIILLFTGIFMYTLPLIKENKKSKCIAGILMIFLGVISILTKYLLPDNLEWFILLFIFFLFLILIYYLLIEPRQKILEKSLALILIALIGIILMYTLGNVIPEISENGFQSFAEYFSLIFFSASLIISLYLILKIIIEVFSEKILKKKFRNNYLYLSFSVGIFILMGGHFYLSKVSKSPLEDFLIIISWAFFLSLAGISALRNILKKS